MEQKLIRQIPTMIVGVILILVLIFAFTQFIRVFRIFGADSNRRILILYFIFAFISGGVKAVGCFMEELLENSYTHYVFDYIPLLFLMTALVTFLVYLLRSLCFRFPSEDKKMHQFFEKAIKVYIFAYWIISIPLISASLYKTISNDGIKTEMDTFEKVLSGSHIVLGILSSIFAIYIIKLYRGQLTNFPTTLKSIKFPMFAVIVGIIIQVIVYSVTNALEAIGTLDAFDEATQNSAFPYYTTVYGLFYIMMNALPIAVYTLYIRKDLDHVELLKKAEGTSFEGGEVSAASALEAQLLNIWLGSE